MELDYFQPGREPGMRPPFGLNPTPFKRPGHTIVSGAFRLAAAGTPAGCSVRIAGLLRQGWPTRSAIDRTWPAS